MPKLLHILAAKGAVFYIRDLNIKTYSLRLHNSSAFGFSPLNVFPFTPIISVSKMRVAPPECINRYESFMISEEAAFDMLRLKLNYDQVKKQHLICNSTSY